MITSVGLDFGYMLISLDVCSVICFDVVCKYVCVWFGWDDDGVVCCVQG